MRPIRRVIREPKDRDSNERMNCLNQISVIHFMAGLAAMIRSSGQWPICVRLDRFIAHAYTQSDGLYSHFDALLPSAFNETLCYSWSRIVSIGFLPLANLHENDRSTWICQYHEWQDECTSIPKLSSEQVNPFISVDRFPRFKTIWNASQLSWKYYSNWIRSSAVLSIVARCLLINLKYLSQRSQQNNKCIPESKYTILLMKKSQDLLVGGGELEWCVIPYQFLPQTAS